MHLNRMDYLVHLRPVISSKRLSRMVYFRSRLSLLRIQLVCLELSQHKTLSLAYSSHPKILKHKSPAHSKHPRIPRHNQTLSHLVKVHSTIKPYLTRIQKKQKVEIFLEKPVLCSMVRTNRQSRKKSSQQSSNLLCLLDRIHL